MSITKRSDPFGGYISDGTQEKLAKYEKLKQLEQFILDSEGMVSQAQPNNTYTESIGDISSREKKVRAQITNYQKQLEEIEALKNFANDTPFKIGDVGFHQEFGNVLIQDVIVQYEVNTRQALKTEYMIFTTHGKQRVLTKDVVPITEATKILFSKKNNG